MNDDTNQNPPSAPESAPVGTADKPEDFSPPADLEDDDLLRPIETSMSPPPSQSLPPDTQVKGNKPKPNFLTEKDRFDLLEADPAITTVTIGAGWEQRAPEGAPIDIDLSCFLLNKDGQTRFNEDFIYYNNERALDNAIVHKGDNRTGAGEGDDEIIYLDLNGLPFDIVQVLFVLSVYDEDRKGYNFGHVRDLYVRLVNESNMHEMLRYVPAEEKVETANALKALLIEREGPRWYVAAPGETTKGYLNEVAAAYGLVIQEDVG